MQKQAGTAREAPKEQETPAEPALITGASDTGAKAPEAAAGPDKGGEEAETDDAATKISQEEGTAEDAGKDADVTKHQGGHSTQRRMGRPSDPP